MTVLHRITPEMATHYKAVRLRALLDTPNAFGSTFLRESQFTDEEWGKRAANLDGERAVGYLAFDGDRYCGIVGCFLHEDDPLKANLVSMWVAPESRRRGVGRLLIDAVQSWAADRGRTTLLLMVTSCNQDAMEFYRSIGFSMTGHTGPYPNDPALIEHEMSRQLS
jgi:ribosomal protein S18 acetylase RimI-like enzyme